MFADLTLATGLFLICASFFAGFVDSIAGGGGLIQLPALLIGLPKTETVTVLGTNKFASVFGNPMSNAGSWINPPPPAIESTNPAKKEAQIRNSPVANVKSANTFLS